MKNGKSEKKFLLCPSSLLCVRKLYLSLSRSFAGNYMFTFQSALPGSGGDDLNHDRFSNWRDNESLLTNFTHRFYTFDV